MRQPSAGRLLKAYGPFFYVFHASLEWVLMPALILMNWRNSSRRRLLIAAATIFYLGRVSSALYFAPHAIDWAVNPPNSLNEVQMWINWNWVRIALQDTLTAVLLILAAARRTLK